MFLSLLQFFATKFLVLALHLESGSFPRPLSAREETEAFSALRAGDPAAREKLIRHNLRLVAHIVKKYYALPGDQDDLISIGTIGLMKAVDTSSADTGRQKAGAVSSLPTMQRSAGQESAAGKVDKRPSVRSAFAIWWIPLVPIFHPCFACEVWQFFSGQTKKLVCKPRYVAAQTGFRYGIILFQLF